MTFYTHKKKHEKTKGFSDFLGKSGFFSLDVCLDQIALDLQHLFTEERKEEQLIYVEKGLNREHY